MDIDLIQRNQKFIDKQLTEKDIPVIAYGCQLILEFREAEKNGTEAFDPTLCCHTCMIEKQFPELKNSHIISIYAVALSVMDSMNL